MASSLKPEQSIPSKESSAEEWISWYKNLRKTLGQDDANPLFVRVWNQRGTDEANTEALREYLAKYDVVIEKDLREAVWDTVTAPLDFLNWGKDIAKYFIYFWIGFLSILALIILYALYNVAKKPNETINSVADFVK